MESLGAESLVDRTLVSMGTDFEPDIKTTGQFLYFLFVSKMLERHFHYLIANYLSEHHPLVNKQWGFQSGTSLIFHI